MKSLLTVRFVTSIKLDLKNQGIDPSHGKGKDRLDDHTIN